MLSLHAWNVCDAHPYGLPLHAWDVLSLHACLGWGFACSYCNCLDGIQATTMHRPSRQWQEAQFLEHTFYNNAPVVCCCCLP